MNSSFIRRLILIPVILFAVNLTSFLIVQALLLRTQYLFSAPPLGEIISPYPAYLVQLLSGNPGSLPTTGAPITTFILDALPKSLVLLGLALFVSVSVGIVAGYLSVNRVKRQTNNMALLVTLAGFSMPSFYFGIVAIYVMLLLSAQRGALGTLLPAGGFGIDEHLILPVLVLAARPTAEIARVTAELLSDELSKDYIRAARAKGLPWRMAAIRHAGSNIASAIVVTIGNSLRYVFSSLLVIETLFAWPGLGRALVSTLTDRGITQWELQPELVAALMTVLALLFLTVALLTDVAAALFDPRLRQVES